MELKLLQQIKIDHSNIWMFTWPGFLNLDATAQFLQHKFASIVVDDEHAVFLVWTLVSFEYSHGGCRALGRKQCK